MQHKRPKKMSVAVLVFVLLGILVAAAIPNHGVVVATTPTASVESQSPPLGQAVEMNSEATPQFRIYHLQLITGDKLVVYVGENGEIENIAVIPADPQKLGQGYMILKTDKGIYVVPVDLDLKKFDIELFNVKRLIRDEYYKEQRIPLIIKYTLSPDEEWNVKAKTITAKVKKEFRTTVEKTFRISPLTAVKAPTDPTKLKEFYNYLKTSSDVAKVWLDRKIRVNLQDSVPMIGAPDVWNLGYNGTGIKIAIVDTGIAWDHPNFILPNGSSKVILNVNFAEYGSVDAYDRAGHGTHVAGIAAGLGVPDMNIAPGVAPGAFLMNIKVLNDDGWGYSSWIMNGIEFAALGPDGIPNTGDEADIISMSLGGPAFADSDPTTELISNVTKMGVVVVVAAGNEGPSYFTVSSPGIAKDAITVGAVDKSKNLAWFSSRGPTPGLRVKPDVAAPGVDIYSSTPWGAEAWSGTSMATPHVSGAAALIRQAHPDWTAQMVKDALVNTAEDLGYNVYEQGSGLINVSRAVQAKILIDPAVIDFGILGDVGVYEKNVTIINLENTTVNINLSVTVHDIMSDTYPNIADLSTYSLTLGPHANTTVALRLNIAPNTTKSLYEGKIVATMSDGEQYKAIFGFTRLNKVTVHAIDIYGNNASYSWVIAFKMNQQNSMDATLSSTDSLTDENGTAVFYLTDGYYKFIYMGTKWEESAGVYAILDNVTITNNTELTIDARDTKEVSLNILSDKIVASKFTEISLRSDYIGWEISSLYWYPATTRTYITPANVTFTTDYEYYPKEYLNINDPGIINTPKWYHLFFAYENITPPLTQTATGLIAKSADYTNPALQDVGAIFAQWAHSTVIPGVGKSFTFGWSYNNPQTRVEYLSKDADYWYLTEKRTDAPNVYTPDWTIIRTDSTDVVEQYIQNKWVIGESPILVAAYPDVWGTSVYIPAAKDSFGHQFIPWAGEMKVQVFENGTLVDNYTTYDFGTIYEPIERNATYRIIINATTPLAILNHATTELYFNNSENLSDNNPPKIVSVYVDGLDLYNKHAPGQITGKVLIEDTNLSTLTMEYSVDGVTWNPVDIQLEESGYYSLYRFNFSVNSPGTVSLRIYAEDGTGNYISTEVTPAFFVKEKEESTISPLWKTSLNTVVTAYAGAKDGLVSVVGTANGDVMYIYRFTGSKIKWSVNLGSEVTAVAVTEDGDFAAVATADGIIHYFNNIGIEKWSVNIGSAANVLEVRGIDGDFVIAGTGDGTIYYISKYRPEKIIWNVTLGSPVTAMDVSADGQKILAGTQDGVVYYINKYRANKVVRTYNVNSRVTALALVPSGDWALIGTQAGNLYYINTYNSNIKWSVSLDSEITSVAIIPGAEGSLMAAGTKLGTVYYINKFAASKIGWSVSLGSEITSVSISSTGDWVVASTLDGKICILNRWSNPHITDVFVSGKNMKGIVTTPDASYIFGFTTDGTVYYITR